MSQGLADIRDQLEFSIQITVDTYGHVVPGRNRQAIDRLNHKPAEGTKVAAQADVA